MPQQTATLQDRDQIRNAILAIAAAHRVTTRTISLSDLDDVDVVLQTEEGRETCSVSWRKRSGADRETKIGWYSSSSNARGLEPVDEMIRHMTAARAIATYLGTLNERVPEGSECPHCGEANPDNLVWDDDEFVHCTSCKNAYAPGATANDE